MIAFVSQVFRTGSYDGYRTAKVMEIAAGTQEIRKLIIARELLKGIG